MSLFDIVVSCECRVGLIGGAWVIGIIDELKMCDKDGMHRPQLIDTKTRNKPTPPSAPQKQNGRYFIKWTLDTFCFNFVI